MRLGISTLLLLFLPLLFSCSDPEPIRIGFVGGLSGRVADLGIAGRNGVILATEQLNQAGGINGRRVELLIRDDEQTAEKALAVVEELIKARVSAIIGHMTSSMSMTTVPLINKAKIVMLSPTTTTTQLRGLDDYFLRVISTTDVYTKTSSGYLLRKGKKRIAAIYDKRNLAYTGSWLDDFSKHLEKNGGKIISTYAFESGADIHFSDLTAKILNDRPDAVVSIANALDTAMFAQQLRKTGSNLMLAACEWAATERLIDLGGPAVEGVILDQFFDRNSQQPSYLAFRQAYKARFATEPGFASVASYDAANIIFHSLEKSSDPATLRETLLQTTTFEGVQSSFTLDRFGDADRPTFLAVIENGQFKRIK